MILDCSATPILERYKAAREAEKLAIDLLHAALAAGEKNQQKLLELTEQMEKAHNAAMSTYQDLNNVRLDKPLQR